MTYVKKHAPREKLNFFKKNYEKMWRNHKKKFYKSCNQKMKLVKKYCNMQL